jgi:hypothetical protein
MVVKTARHKALPFAIGGVLAGAVICHFFDWAFLKSVNSFVPNLEELLAFAILLLAVFFRFKQT